MGKHTCHWPDCKVEVPPKMWGCLPHWRQLPKWLRDEIWLTYVPGQEITKTPSAAYIKVARKAQDWISGFCHGCGASIPHRDGEGRCERCMWAIGR